MKYSYDDLYGMSLDEYCKFHNITVKDLINKTKKDILLLAKRLNNLVYSREWLKDDDWNLIEQIIKLKKKKEKHLKRLEKWNKTNK